MAKGFNTPQLDLKRELPDVVSRDFNLFYKPEAEPEIAGLKNFTNSLSNFMEGALTTGNLVAEQKQKETSEAEAVKFYNQQVQNKKGFNSAVDKGEIPREANPYYIEKLQELELGTKVQEFKGIFAKRYAEENLGENTDPNAFNLIYEEELKKFIKQNNLGLYDAITLEKNFFSKTTNFRNNTENEHINNQLVKIREQFDKNYKTGVQEFFDPDSNDFVKMGQDISTFIKEAVESGMSKTKARDLYMESLKEYVELTGDLEFASKLINELPKHIKLGTDVLGNINSLKDDFSFLEDDLETRRNQEELDKITKQEMQIKQENFVVNDLTNKYDTYTDLKNSDEFFILNNRQKQEALTIYENRRIGFGTFNDPDAVDTLKDLINQQKFDEAKEYLDSNRTLFQQEQWFDFDAKVQAYIDTKGDPFIGNFQYNTVINKVQTLVDDINSKAQFEIVVDAVVIAEFKEDINEWLKFHPLEKFDGDASARKDAFIEWSNARSQQFINILTENYVDNDRLLEAPKFETEEFDPSLLEDEDKGEGGDELDEALDNIGVGADDEEIDQNSNYLDENNKPVIFIPPDLSAVNRRKFKRKYPDAITFEEFEENLNKQREADNPQPPNKEELEEELANLKAQKKTKKVRERIKEIETLLEGME